MTDTPEGLLGASLLAFSLTWKLYAFFEFLRNWKQMMQQLKGQALE